MSKLEIVAECAMELQEHLDTEFPNCKFNISGNANVVDVILVESKEPPMERLKYAPEATATKFWMDMQEYIDAITRERRDELNFTIVYDISRNQKKIAQELGKVNGRKIYQKGTESVQNPGNRKMYSRK